MPPDLDFVFTRYERNETCRRTEVDFIVRFAGAIPSRTDILENCANFFQFEGKLAVLDRLRSKSGKRELRGSLRIYDTPEALKQNERS
jgi:small subunit ribosomal protein S24e